MERDEIAACVPTKRQGVSFAMEQWTHSIESIRGLYTSGHAGFIAALFMRGGFIASDGVFRR